MLHLGVISSICVSKDHVVNMFKYHGHRNFLGLGLFEELKMASFWAYKGSGLNIAQMGLSPKDEMQEMPKYSSPEFIRNFGDT